MMLLRRRGVGNRGLALEHRSLMVLAKRATNCLLAPTALLVRRRGVANRDVKLENLLVDSSMARPLLKICDLSYSKARARHDATAQLPCMQMRLQPCLQAMRGTAICAGS